MTRHRGTQYGVALITTFYGGYGLLVLLPMAKAQTEEQEEILLKEILVEGMLSIQAGKPKNYRGKTRSFLSPKIKGTVKEGKREESGREAYASARNRGQNRGSGVSEWMTTYSDLVTLLLCFFVLLFPSRN